MPVELKHTTHAVGQSAYHFVWKPKYNVKVFLHPWPRKVAEEAIMQVAIKWKIQIRELKVMPGHVHCFAEIPLTMSVSFALQILKGGSARIIFQKCTRWRAFFAEGHKVVHLWSPGKFFRSVGAVSAEIVEAYIKHSQGEWNFGFAEEEQRRINLN